MEGKRGRGRPRQKLLDWMMSKGYSKLKEEAQNRETWSHCRSRPARGQRTYRRSHRKFQQNNYAATMASAARQQIIGGGGGAPINKSRWRPQIVGGAAGSWFYTVPHKKHTKKSFQKSYTIKRRVYVFVRIVLRSTHEPLNAGT